MSKPSPCPTLEGVNEAYRECRVRLEHLAMLAKALQKRKEERSHIVHLCKQLGYTPPTEGGR